MLNLSPTLIAEKNKLSSSSAWLVLLEITVPNYGLTIRLVKNNEDVIFGGNTYIAFPLEVDMSKWTSKGDVPTLGVKVSNIANTFNQILREYSGGVGGTVVLTLVSSEHLTEDYAEFTRSFTILDASVDNYWVSWTLGSANPLRQRFPLYTYMAHYCNWVQNFKGPECKLSTFSFIEDFNALSATWLGFSTAGETSVANSILTIGNNSGPDNHAMVYQVNYAYDPTLLYKISAKVRRTAGTGTFSVGVIGVAANGTSLVSATTGANTFNNPHYIGASGALPTLNEWVEYIGYFKGFGVTGDTTAHPDINSPGVLHENVRFFRPAIGANLQFAQGIYEIDYFKIEVGGSTCNGTWQQCQDYSNTANFGGFPGLYNPEVRVV